MADAAELIKMFMRSVAQPVFVVTARSDKGYAAFTASSVTSISLNPPLMMVSVAKASRNHDPLVSSQRFIITLLSCEHRSIAEIMAQRMDPLAKLKMVGYRESDYGPVIPGAARLYLKNYKAYDGGDHTIVLGLVEGGEAPGEPLGKPLVYHARSYKTVGPGC